MFKKRPVKDLLASDRLLTAPEVARILHISRTTIYLLIHRGDLPTVRIGHALRFRPQDVEAYIRKRAGQVRAAGRRRHG